MNTRSLAIAAALFFALAPTALATQCGVGGTCQYLYCGSNTTAVAGSSDCNWVVGQLCCAPSVQPTQGNVIVPGNGNVIPSPSQITPAPTTPAPSTANPSPTINQNPSPTVNPSVNPYSVPSTNVTLINPLGVGNCSSANGGCLMTFLNQILKFVIQIGAVVVVLMLVYVGFLFVVAQGNESKLTAAKQALLWTVIGALILLGAQAISSGIQATVQALSTGS